MCSWSFPDGKPSHARGQHGLQSLGVASRERVDGARVDGVRDCVWAKRAAQVQAQGPEPTTEETRVGIARSPGRA